MTVLGQLDQGPDLVIASVPSITEVTQLQGNPIIVDSPSSGYSYLVQYVLSQFNLTLANGDYWFQTVGGTSTRYADLLSGTLANGSAVYATMLNYPFTVESQSLADETQEPTILARISDYVAPITSSAFTVVESSVANATQAALLARFLASMHAANAFLLDPTTKDCAIAAIAAELDITTDVAAEEYASVTDSVSGEIAPDGWFEVNQEGIMNDVAVRLQFGGFSSLSSDFDFAAALEAGTGNLIDYAVLDAAKDVYAEIAAQFAVENCTALSQ